MLALFFSILSLCAASPLEIPRPIQMSTLLKTEPSRSNTLGQLDIGALLWNGSWGRLRANSLGVETGWSGPWVASIPWLRPKLAVGYVPLVGQETDVQLFGGMVHGTAGVEAKPFQVGFFFPALSLSIGPAWLLGSSAGGTRGQAQTWFLIEPGFSLHFSFSSFEIRALVSRQLNVLDASSNSSRFVLSAGISLN